VQLGYIAGNLYVEVVSGWRYMYATSTPLCLIMGVGMCWLPSSPRWLLLCAIQGKGNLPETWPSPLLRSHSTFETVGEFFRRNHPDHYLGQQVHGLLLHLGLIHLVHSTRFWTNHKLWLLRNVVIKKATLLFIVSLFTTQIDMLNLWRKGRGFKTGWITISWSLKGILRKDQLDG